MISIIDIKGMTPKRNARLLPHNYAQTAQNCELQSGVIVPMNDLTSALSLGTGTAWLTFYKFYDKYLYWDEDVDVIEGPKVDSVRRLMWTGDGSNPKQMKYSDKTGNGEPNALTESRALGLQSPQGRATVTTYFTWEDDPDWASGSFYNLNDFVRVVCSGITFRCKKTHTAFTAAQIADPVTLWNYIATYWEVTTYDSGAAAWAESHSYTANDTVYVGGSLYLPWKCIKAHQASSDTKPGAGSRWTTYWKWSPEGDYIDEVSYVYTYVTDWKEESAPSLPTQPEAAYTRTVKVLTGFEFTDTNGTVTVGAGNLKLITGSGTDFDEVFRTGDYILVNNQMRIIDTVTNATSMTVTQNFDAAFSGETYQYYPENVRYLRVYRLSTGTFGSEYSYLPYWHSPAYWVTGTRYYNAQYVAKTHPSDPGDEVFPRKTIYRALQEHVAGATNEPGVGVSWATYWELVNNDLFVTDENGMPVEAYYQGMIDANFGPVWSDIVHPYRINQNLEGVIETEKWDEPDNNLEGLIECPWGGYAGFVGNFVYFSEIFVAYAYPQDYKMVVSNQIIGLAAYGTSVMVLTEGWPVIMTGLPGGMSQKTLKVPQSCLSKRSIQVTEYGVVYASPDGLILLTESGWENLTKEIFTKAQWNAYNPEYFIGAYYDRKYFAFSTASNTVLIFDFENRNGIFIVTHALATGMTVKCAQVLIEEDALYIMTRTSGASYAIQTWGTGSGLEWTWKSKKFTFGVLANLSCIKIIGTQTYSSPVELSVYYDEDLYQTQKIGNKDVYRLDPSIPYDTFEIQIVGTCEVHSIVLGNDPDELRG